MFWNIFVTIVNTALFAALIVFVILIVRALRKYLRSDEPRKEPTCSEQPLSQTLKAHRVRCKMTQEFVAASLGVSRQAVSKWENGTAAPSTSNLLELAKLYGVSADELLRNTQPS